MTVTLDLTAPIQAMIDASIAKIVLIPGPQGIRGPVGPTGPQGPQGLPGASGPPVTPPPTGTVVPTPTNGAKLLFNDEFDALDLASPSNPSGVWRPNDFWQNLSLGYKDFAGTSWNANPNEAAVGINPFSVANSILTITVKKITAAQAPAIAASMAAQGQSPGAPTWAGGFLVTNSNLTKLLFRYGYFEWKAQWPNPGKGMFPALWLYHAAGSDGKSSAEVDVMEIFGQAGIMSGGIHGPADVNGYNLTADTAAWHTYGIDWQPNSITFYHDGKAVGTPITGANAAWFTTNMAIRLNFAMDAPWFAATHSDATTPDGMQMNVDYVRVYDKVPTF